MRPRRSSARMRASSSENANGLVEAHHPVLDRVLRCNDQYRRLIATLAQRREDIDTVAARQHKIEQQKIEGTLAREEKAFLSGCSDRDFVVLCFKALAQRIRDLLFVLNDQNTHATLRSAPRVALAPAL
jgi:hypothetical protein